MATCANCGEEFEPSGKGRPPRFCSDECRKAKHQRKRTLTAQVNRYERLAAQPYWGREWWLKADDARTELEALGDDPRADA
ncbi:hypothetical protein ACLGIH_24770 [Streptomyces sp. HMX87]|uniref:hypothetical protein n=1 Tax=Streptomyces sp. HMX87 TaxID=3390849 RepID=UPI003A85D422